MAVSSSDVAVTVSVHELETESLNLLSANEEGVVTGKVWDADSGDLSELSTDLDPSEFAETDAAWLERDSADLSELSSDVGSKTPIESSFASPEPSGTLDAQSFVLADIHRSSQECGMSMPNIEWEDSLIILDWDDTIFPTTWLQELGFGADSELHPTKEQWTLLCRLAERAARTLHELKQLGTVVIITNAETGWIEISCQTFLPWLCPYLKDIKTLSARSANEPFGVQSPTEWKCRSFETEIDSFCHIAVSPGRRPLNFISIGDSLHEREALMRATASPHMPMCVRKSVKFIERPDIQQLAKEHEILATCMHEIYRNMGNLDLCIGNS